MPRKLLDQELQRLKDEILVLGVMVERSVLDAVEALRNRDHKMALRILELDQKINAQRFAIEKDAIALIATQQPMARDLRLLTAILAVSAELERIGDYAKGIAQITLRMNELPSSPLIGGIPRMAQKATDMLHRALSAFVNEDTAIAQALPREDDEVDALYLLVQQQLLHLIQQNPQSAERANWLLWAAHNLERAADRVTNICERTIYAVTGEMVEMDVSWDELKEENQ